MTVSNKLSYKERVAQKIKDFGQYLVGHADELASDADVCSSIYFMFEAINDDEQSSFDVTKNYIRYGSDFLETEMKEVTTSND